jgi:hypothetical protein
MKKFTIRMLVVIFLTTICSSAIAGDVINYTGNETAEEITAADADGTYHITTAGNLKWLQDVCSSSSTYTKASGKTYKLMYDVVISDGVNWVPIGTAPSQYGCFFGGSFDGNGKTVSGLNCTGSSYCYTGFFGRVNGGTVKNLTVKGKEVSTSWTKPTGAKGSSYARIGGIVGELDKGSIIGCYAQIDLLACTSSNYGIGGIVGYVGGTSTIEGCISNCGDIEPNKDGKAGTNCGGVIGTIGGNIFVSVISCVSNCKKINAVAGSTTSSSNNRRGGVIGGCGNGTTGDAKGKVTVNQCWYVTDSYDLGGIDTALGSINLSAGYTQIDDAANQWGSVLIAADLDAKVADLNQAIKDNGDESVVKFVTGLSLSYDVQTAGIGGVESAENPNMITKTSDGLKANFNGVLSIYSVDGRLLNDTPVITGETVALHKGIYIIKAHSGKQLYSIKCVQ